ncbi:GspH/FimT family pseudopilin [Litorivicinus lipolyticus]|jgi:type IV fimbrial biogenesis protein FimT|uniref:GspH/FimT family pseudopilin n=1 Tax=Litorivicinus lipolyticus TaxID=418701 RepID=UPI003B59ECE3
MRKNAGFSLLESLIVVALIALLATLATSGGQSSLERVRVHQQRAALSKLLMLARATAITRASPVQVDRIDGQWWLLDARGAPLQTANAEHARWRGFLALPIQFSADGGASNGSLWFCVAPFEHARGLTLSRAGRLRRSTDRNHDGVHETGAGTAIDCAR